MPFVPKGEKQMHDHMLLWYGECCTVAVWHFFLSAVDLFAVIMD